MITTQIDLIVARYNESPDWITNFPGLSRVFLYNKGGASLSPLDLPCNTSIIPLPNLGRETQTYLHHIVTNYDDLAAVNIFFQGEVDDRPEQKIMGYDSYTSITSWGFAGKLDTCFESYSWGRELDSISSISAFKSSFGEFIVDTLDMPWRDKCLFTKGAYFSVGRDRIRLRSRDFYQMILDKHELSTHVNPRAGHYMERSWFRLFGEVH